MQPHTTQLQGTDGSNVESFTDQPVTGLKPRLESATVEGATLTLTFNETLDAGSLPWRHLFHVTVNDARRLVSAGGVAIAGKTVRLTLASAVAAGDTVKVRYTEDRAGLRGASGIAVDGFPDQAVTYYTQASILWSATLQVSEDTGTVFGCTSLTCSTQLTNYRFSHGGTSFEVVNVIRWQGTNAAFGLEITFNVSGAAPPPTPIYMECGLLTLSPRRVSRCRRLNAVPAPIGIG